jgi:hypothetical protein
LDLHNIEKDTRRGVLLQRKGLHFRNAEAMRGRETYQLRPLDANEDKV